MAKTEDGQRIASNVINSCGGLANACAQFAKIMHEQSLPGTEAFLIPYFLERAAAELKRLEPPSRYECCPLCGYG